jgi:hypothetical protein
MREELVNALIKHAEGEVEKHRVNVEVYMRKVVGIGEHSDIVETLQKELDSLAAADDRLEMLKKYF